jgi:hypothetical protein
MYMIMLERLSIVKYKIKLCRILVFNVCACIIRIAPGDSAPEAMEGGDGMRRTTRP